MKKQEKNPEEEKKNKYIYKSRHLHASRRLRGKDGKFLASNIYFIQLDLKARDLERRKNEEENPKIKQINLTALINV